MKLFLDSIAFDIQEIGGVSVYWNELIRWLNANGADPTIFTRDSLPESSIGRNCIDDNAPICRVESRLPPKVLRYFPMRKRLEDGALFHSGYYRVTHQKKIANVITVYDFINELFRKDLARLVHSAQKSHAIRRADGIICISESTRRDLLRLFPDVPGDRVQVIHLGVGSHFMPVAEDTMRHPLLDEVLARKYALYVSNRAAYKNFELIVDSIADTDDLSLVIVGGGALSTGERHLLDLKLKGRYFPFQYIDGRDLNILYNRAHCLLYLSNYEGFGIPVAEAMKAGCPVVISGKASLPEVAGSAGLVVDQLDVRSVIGRLRELDASDLRTEMIQRGVERSREFSWENCCSKTLAFYQEVLEKKIAR